MSQNHLAQSTSPYLLQHADNPVHWYPWGEDALELAKKENKPILLSIGYSACHWCHVMAHESFENEATAQVMNEHFINIKVDREERPDLDKLYQTAHSLITQRNGGWPLTMFLTPDNQLPFFGGTYFPDQPRHGLPAFRELLVQVSAYFQQHRDQIDQQNQQLADTFERIYQGNNDGATPDSSILDAARMELAQDFDQRHGGLGQAPKFPHVGALERLLRHWAATRLLSEEDHQALHMVQFTLRKMSEGGVFDHLGGGFCRYSVDDHWMIPHFEKMLYDNGPLLGLLSELHVATGDELFARTARKLAGWVMREMQSSAGGYYCALDADSEGEEGRFYYWEPEQVAMITGPQTYPLFAARYGLDRQPNFEGKWHLHTYTSTEELSQTFSLSENDVLQQIEYAEKKLFEERERRTRPGLDDKILTSWNALMIKGMLQAARHLQEPEFAESAIRALDFIRETMWVDGRLKAACKDERVQLNAYLDDYAFMIEALLESLQWQWNPDHLQFSRDLADTLLAHFRSEQGGFYFTSDDHEQLIERPRSFGDEAMPSGNAIAARALLRLGYLLGETRYLDAAESTLRAGAQLMQQAPSGHACLANALEEQLYPPTLLVVRGETETISPLKNELDARYSPRLLLFAIPDDATELPEGLASKVPGAGITGYICEGLSCRPPVTDSAELSDLIRELSIGAD